MSARAEMDIDLLVIDLDGTLIDRQRRVSPANRAAVAAARAAGIAVVIATGRTMSEAKPMMDAIGYEGLLIAAGGSIMYQVPSGRTVERSAMPAELVRDVTNLLVQAGHKVLLLKDVHITGYDYLVVGPGEMDPCVEWWFNTLPVQVRHADHVHEDAHPHDTIRAGAAAPEAVAARTAGLIRDQIGDRAHLHHWSAVTATHATGSPTHLLEIFNRNVNKWTMIRQYCDHHAIDPARVAAIGDELNDIEMIRHSGLGVAMGNAIEDVKAVANFITDDHESDGVARAIDHILDGRWRPPLAATGDPHATGAEA